MHLKKFWLFVTDDRLLHRRRDALEEVLAWLVALAGKLALDGRRVGRQVGPGTAVLGALGQFWGSGTGLSKDFGHQVGPRTVVLKALGSQVGPGTTVLMALGRQVCSGTAFSRDLGR